MFILISLIIGLKKHKKWPKNRGKKPLYSITIVIQYRKNEQLDVERHLFFLFRPPKLPDFSPYSKRDRRKFTNRVNELSSKRPYNERRQSYVKD